MSYDRNASNISNPMMMGSAVIITFMVVVATTAADALAHALIPPAAPKSSKPIPQGQLEGSDGHLAQVVGVEDALHMVDKVQPRKLEEGLEPAEVVSCRSVARLHWKIRHHCAQQIQPKKQVGLEQEARRSLAKRNSESSSALIAVKPLVGSVTFQYPD